MEPVEVPIKRIEPIDVAAYAKQHDKLAQLGDSVLRILRCNPHLLNSELPHAETRAEMMVRFLSVQQVARSLGLLSEDRCDHGYGRPLDEFSPFPVITRPAAMMARPQETDQAGDVDRDARATGGTWQSEERARIEREEETGRR